MLSVLIILACGCIRVVDDKTQTGEDETQAAGDDARQVDDKTPGSDTTPTTPSLKPNEVRVIACKNFGRDEILNAAYKLSDVDCAMDALQSVANVETAYNGGFVNAINGIRSGYTGSRSEKTDWFYYINGILANTGSLDYTLQEGDVERWDHHDWSYQLFIPAVVGDYPEPFLHGIEGNVLATVIAYDDYKFRDDADEIKNSLIKLGVKPQNTPGGSNK